MPHDPVPGLLARATEVLEAEFRALPEFDVEPASSAEAMAQVLEAAAHRLGDNYPYFHPLYAGQMLKPPHPVARAAYALAMKINPNNHAQGRRPGQLGDGSGGGRGDRRDVWVEGVPGPPDLERNHRQPGSAVDGGAVGAGTADCGLGAGALHAPADFRSAEAGVRGHCEPTTAGG